MHIKRTSQIVSVYVYIDPSRVINNFRKKGAFSPCYCSSDITLIYIRNPIIFFNLTVSKSACFSYPLFSQHSKLSRGVHCVNVQGFSRTLPPPPAAPSPPFLLWRGGYSYTLASRVLNRWSSGKKLPLMECNQEKASCSCSLDISEFVSVKSFQS